MNDTSGPTVLPVNLGDRSYEIRIADGIIRGTGLDHDIPGLSGTHAVIITDFNVAELYLEDVQSWIANRFDRVHHLKVSPGESAKSLNECQRLWSGMLDCRTDRKSVVIALGGGVPGDLAGFVAATFARGLRFVQIPTTLLAQVDSSVGGKTGINLPTAKNMVGAFWQPQSVLIDPGVLSTLSPEEYRSGLAEVIKYGVIADESLFEFLEQNVEAINGRDSQCLHEIIAWSCRIKADVVAADEKESGRRMILNYGHTFGHAIESVFQYGTYTHGAAIAIGMNCAARLANALDMTDNSVLERQLGLMKSLQIETDWPREKHAELLSAMQQDKKVLAGKLKLILPNRIGDVSIVDAPEDSLILDSMNNG